MLQSPVMNLGKNLNNWKTNTTNYIQQTGSKIIKKGKKDISNTNRVIAKTLSDGKNTARLAQLLLEQHKRDLKNLQKAKEMANSRKETEEFLLFLKLILCDNCIII